MKRVLYRTTLAVALAAIAVTGAFAFGQNPPPPQQPGGMMMHGRGGQGPGPMAMLRHLNLTDTQRTQIQSFMQQHRQADQADMQKLRTLQQQLKNAIFADSPADTSALQDQIASLQAKLQADRIAMERQIAGVLTADQRKQVRDMPGPGFGPMLGRGRGMQHGGGWGR